jgi:two-component system chemotaxis response regulator CheB
VDQPQHQTLDSVAHRLVAIGASTGGPSALTQLLTALPGDQFVPIVVAQHMLEQLLPQFENHLADSLSQSVRLATDNTIIKNGVIYILPAECDTKIMRDSLGNPRFFNVPSSFTLRPSIDALMESAATVFASNCLGIILTGMGRDGLEGMRAIKELGGATIVQNEATSAVYGMAQAVENEHLADRILPLSDIPNAIYEWCQVL